MRSSLATGGYGFRGSALVRSLLQRGVEVTVVKRDTTPRSALVLENLERSINVVVGDVRDASLVERHALAGRSPIVRSDGTPERDFLYYAP